MNLRIVPALVTSFFVSSATLAADSPNTVFIALQDPLYDAATRTANIAAKALDFYRQSIFPIDYPPIEALASDSRAGAGVVEALGSVDGIRVFTVDYPSGLLAVIAEQQQDRFLPVLYLHRRVSIELLRIVSVDGIDFLAYVGDRPGTGNMKDEFYFVAVEGKLRRVEYETVLQTALESGLPAGYGILKGGGFDISKLQYQWWVWKDGDANCCPSGGQITVDFGFSNNSFIVESSDWQPDLRP